VRIGAFGAFEATRHAGTLRRPSTTLRQNSSAGMLDGRLQMAGTENEALALLLGRVEWSPEAFARQLNRFARELGRTDHLDVKTPYKWLRGGHPRSPWPALAAALLSRELGEQITTADLRWHGDDRPQLWPASAGLIAPWTVEGTLTTASKVSENSAMDRRSFLLLIGTALTSPAHEWLIARPVLDASRADGRVVTAELADHLDTVTDQLRRMDDQVGGGSLIDVVRSQTDYVVGLLSNGSFTDTTGRRLHTTVAELLRLAGWLSFDSGRHAEAQRFFIAALHAAHSAGDRELGANVLGFMSCQAKDLGKYDDATKLADTALAGYKGASPRVSAILHMRAAQAYANAGDATESRRSIEAAYSAFRDLAPAHGEPAWAYWLDEAQINEQIGYCYLKLRDWPRATSHMGTAVRLQGSTSTREGALRLTLLADTYAQQGEPERACELGTRAIDTLASQVDSTRCVGHVQTLRDHLTPYRRVPAVQGLTARVEQLAAT
jgi:hypothetical protein